MKTLSCNASGTILRALLALFLLAAVQPARAETVSNAAKESVGHDFGTQGAPASVPFYTRERAQVTVIKNTTLSDISACRGDDVTCSSPAPTQATATVQCGSSGPGGWAPSAVSGYCGLDYDFCFVRNDGYVDSSACRAQHKTAATASDVVIASSSKCTTATAKGYCLYDESGSSNMTGDTGDDMFKIRPNTNTFFEYKNLPAGDPARLQFISRGPGGKPIMMPSGPPGNFSDYRSFINNIESSGAGISLAKGCYPADHIDICTTALVTDLPVVNNGCGGANGKNYATASDIPDAARCVYGDATGLSQSASTITWTCPGLGGGSASSCSASRLGVCGSANGSEFQNMESIPPSAFCSFGNAVSKATVRSTLSWKCEGYSGGGAQSCAARKKADTIPGDDPPGQIDPPTTFCFFNVSGVLFDNKVVPGWFTIIGSTDMYSNLVGPGNYANASPFLRAHTYTFDGIAIGKDTHVTIYSQPNFGGSIILDTDGPLVLNNAIWKTSPQAQTGWKTNAWPGEFQGQFPPSSRYWSDEFGGVGVTTNMHNWGSGTSLKVSCK